MTGRSKMLVLVSLLLLILNGCGAKEQENDTVSELTKDTVNDSEMTLEKTSELPKTGLAYETAADAEIDFAALQSENPDIFAWIHIPGTNIDAPVLQSEEADDFYETHTASGSPGTEGAIYTELANLRNMCDFNTVFHGKTLKEGGIFSELYRYSDIEYMKEHSEVYLYLPDNLLTYEVFAAYERENTSLIRTYDFTYLSGCQEFLDDLYSARVMDKTIKEGWEDVTPYHFLITLTTTSPDKPEKQYVVVAALMSDAAGTIDRIVSD